MVQLPLRSRLRDASSLFLLLMTVTIVPRTFITLLLMINPQVAGSTLFVLTPVYPLFYLAALLSGAWLLLRHNRTGSERQQVQTWLMALVAVEALNVGGNAAGL
ncbi:MAG: hypothetical protein AAF809_15160 [Bacteroidota bacterium]